MIEKVRFALGRFGPFDGELIVNNVARTSSYALKFGPLFVNASALRSEKSVVIYRKFRAPIIGQFTGVIHYSDITHAVSGDLTIFEDDLLAGETLDSERLFPSGHTLK